MSDETKPLRWTSEPPKVPGWYFVRGDTVGTTVSWESGRPWDYEEGPPPSGLEYAGPIPEPIVADEPAAPTLRDEAAAVLAQLDGLAHQIGDEGVFRRCRDRLRAALEGGGA